jgi:N-acetylglucosamine repressor
MLGDGVGLGILSDGQILRGLHSASNEFGHVRLAAGGAQCRCGARGCIESAVADYALYRDAMLVCDMPALDSGHQPSEAAMQALLAKAEAGEEPVLRLFEQAGQTLAAGVTALVHLFQFDAIVFCGPGVRAREHLEPAFFAQIRQLAIPELLSRTRFATLHYTPELLTGGVILRALEQVDRHLAVGSA